MKKKTRLIPLSVTAELIENCQASLQGWLDSADRVQAEYPPGLNLRVEPATCAETVVFAQFFPNSPSRRVWEFKLADQVNFSLSWQVRDMKVTDLAFYLPSDTWESHVQLVAAVSLEADGLRPE